MNRSTRSLLTGTTILAAGLTTTAQTAVPAPTSEPARLVFGDYDADGRSDVVALAPDRPLRLLHNLGDGQYEEVALLLGLGQIQDASFALWGDYDADGHSDLLVGSAHGPRHLFRNLEGGAFVDVAAELGLAGQGGDRSAHWIDADGDGRLDLHLEGADGGRLYRALADGTFEEALISSAASASAGGWLPAIEVETPPADSTGSGKVLGNTVIDGTRTTVVEGPGGRIELGGGASFGGATPIVTLPSGCATSIRDQAAPASCLQASSAATLGLLYPMSTALNVDEATGRVGMGTTSPTADLTVITEGASDGIHVSNSVDASLIALIPPSPTGGFTGGVGTISSHDLPLYTSNLDRVLIKADGRVGVGTSTPSELLDVGGLVQIDTDINVTADGGMQTRYSSGNLAALISGFDAGPSFNGYQIALVNNAETALSASVYHDAVTDTATVFAGVKSFRVDNPDDPGDTDLVYACVEGPEAAMYLRGTAQLVNGAATVVLPRHFEVMAVAQGMTVQLTPGSAASQGLAVLGKSPQSFEVRELRNGRGNYAFDWEVKAVRKGYENFEVVRPKLRPQRAATAPTPAEAR